MPGPRPELTDSVGDFSVGDFADSVGDFRVGGPNGFGACVGNTNPTQIQYDPTQIDKFPSARWVWRVCCQHKSNTNPTQPNTNC